MVQPHRGLATREKWDNRIEMALLFEGSSSLTSREGGGGDPSPSHAESTNALRGAHDAQRNPRRAANFGRCPSRILCSRFCSLASRSGACGPHDRIGRHISRKRVGCTFYHRHLSEIRGFSRGVISGRRATTIRSALLPRKPCPPTTRNQKAQLRRHALQPRGREGVPNIWPHRTSSKKRALDPPKPGSWKRLHSPNSLCPCSISIPRMPRSFAAAVMSGV